MKFEQNKVITVDGVDRRQHANTEDPFHITGHHHDAEYVGERSDWI